MRYFYARVSSKGQNLDRQLETAKELNCEEIVTDKESGKDFNRPGWQGLLSKLKAGDTVVVASLDRFGRDYTLVPKEIQKLRDMGVGFEVADFPALNVSGDLTETFIADLIIMVLSYVAETERRYIKKRQKEGIAVAKANGVKLGKEPLNIVIDKPEEESVSAYCKRMGISRTTYYKYAN